MKKMNTKNGKDGIMVNRIGERENRGTGGGFFLSISLSPFLRFIFQPSILPAFQSSFWSCTRVIKVALCILLLGSDGKKEAYAQFYPDAGSWCTFNIEHPVGNNAALVVTEEYRMKENFSRLNLFYTNVGMEYKVSKRIKTALIYRFINKFQDDDSFSFRHRLMFDASVKDKFGKFILSYRHRLQAEIRDIYSSRDGKVPEWYSRNKFSVKYDLDKPYTPSVEAELRYQIHDPREVESDKTWHRIRYAVGMNYKINLKNTISVYYLIQREWNVLFPQKLYIAGIEYTLTL